MDTETETPKKEAIDEREDSGRLARLANEFRGLVEDVRTWVDLKLKLLEVQVEERVRDAVNRVAVTAFIAMLVFLSGVFVLVTAALALGDWWDSPTLGFLAVTLALIVITLLLYVLRPGLVRRRARSPSDEPEDRALPEARDRRRLEPKSGSPTRDDSTDTASRAPAANGHE